MRGKQTTHKRANKQTKLRQKQQTNGQSSHMETEEERRKKRDEDVDEGQREEQALKEQHHLGQRAKDTWGAHDGTI